MLIKFTVGNYLSFKDKAALDMTAEALKEKKHNLHIPYLYNSRLSLLKSVAIYGHNSHGKTNFLRAYAFFQKFILTSFELGKTNGKIDVEPFGLNTISPHSPSHFEVIFLIKGTKYRYGFEITEQQVTGEWLFYAESGVRENPLFNRVEQEFRDVSRLWNKDSGNKIEQARIFTKPHNLFLSILLSQDNIPRVDLIASWIKGNIILSGNYGSMLQNGADKIYSKVDYRSAILKFIGAGDMGFTNIFEKVSAVIEKGYSAELIGFLYEIEKKNFDLYTHHHVFDENYHLVKSVEFELRKNESSGTIKYFIVSCFLAYTIRNSQLIWIDELDSSLHTALLILLIKTFNDQRNNSTGAQLIFTTHNTALLNKQLRRDQFVFIQKNKFGESVIEKMHSSQNPIRIEKSVEQEYRDGLLKAGVSEKVIKSDIPTLFDPGDSK